VLYRESLKDDNLLKDGAPNAQGLQRAMEYEDKTANRYIRKLCAVLADCKDAEGFETYAKYLEDQAAEAEATAESEEDRTGGFYVKPSSDDPIVFF